MHLDRNVDETERAVVVDDGGDVHHVQHPFLNSKFHVSRLALHKLTLVPRMERVLLSEMAEECADNTAVDPSEKLCGVVKDTPTTISRHR